MNLNERDRKIIWHPFTQEKTCGPLVPIVKGSGSYLYDEKGKKYLDFISSWWVNIHGHANAEIAKAIYTQSTKLEHVIFAGFTHEPAVEICEMLNSLLPERLEKFFFSDNGSTAVEVALKLSYQYWINRGITNKTLFLCFDGAYHGDTLGSMSVGAGSGYHKVYQKLLLPVLTAEFADTFIDDPDIDVKEERAIKNLENTLKNNGDKIASLIMEPLIQGAGGMRMCRPQFVERVVNLARTYNILVIFDEIFVGFGRTGTNFAFEQTYVVPDFLCLSKGLTGGFMPLSITVTTLQIYNEFYDFSYDKTFLHGHSYTANPLGCAAAIASLKILTRQSTKDAIKEIHDSHKRNLVQLRQVCPNVSHTRVTGTVAAFDIDGKDIMLDVKKKCLENGLMIRPLHRTVYFLPPYTTTSAEVDDAYNTVAKIIKLCESS